jgi:beta-glucoside kinase
MDLFAVFDIGGTSIKHSVMDRQGQALIASTHPTPEQGDNKIFEVLSSIINKYKKRYPIKGVALSVPGAVDIDSGEVYFAGAVTDLMHKRIKEELKDVGLPIELENDANCSALAEKWKGNAVHNENFVCITVGTGIGGAIFLNGDLYRGKFGMAGEFGLICLNMSNNLESLIDNYSFSRIGSTWNLVNRVSKFYNKKITGEEIFQLYRQGNENVVREVNSFYNALAIGTANLIHALAPEKVLFGGGVSSQKNFISEIKDRIKKIRPEALEISEIDHCLYFNQSGQLGALYHFLKQRNAL